MPFKLESFSHETTCLHATVISTVSVRVAVTSLPAPLAIKGSVWNRQDVRLTGRSPIRAGHVRNHPIPNTGRSIGASLIASSLYSIQFSGNLFGNSQYFLQFCLPFLFLFLYFNMYFILFCVFLILYILCLFLFFFSFYNIFFF